MRFAQTNLQLYEQVAHLPDANRLRVHDAYNLAAALFAGQYRGSGKPFVAHLVGTASVLVRHGAAVDVVLAGLVHAAYQRGEFGTGRYGMTERRRQRVRAIIGEAAESLVARYTEYDWSSVPDRIQPADSPVVLIRIANEVDECLDQGLLYVAARKRRAVESGISRFVAAARGLRLPELAEQLERVAAENHGTPPKGLSVNRNGSFSVPPPLLGTIVSRLRDVKRKLRG